MAGRPDDAKKTLEKALEISPESTELLTTLALLYLDTGNSSRAFTLFGTALTYDAADSAAIVGAGAVVQEAEGVRLHMSSKSATGYLGVYKDRSRFKARCFRAGLPGSRPFWTLFHVSNRV